MTGNPSKYARNRGLTRIMERSIVPAKGDILIEYMPSVVVIGFGFSLHPLSSKYGVG